MVIINKEQAKQERIELDVICDFHVRNPDQQAITESCPDCKIIRDPCGCDADMGCERCEPKEVKGGNSSHK